MSYDISASIETDCGVKHRDSIPEKFWKLSPDEAVKADSGDLYIHIYLFKSQFVLHVPIGDRSVGKATNIRAGGPRNRGSIPGRRNTFFFNLPYPELLWTLPNQCGPGAPPHQ
jgi:hypothetical protein